MTKGTKSWDITEIIGEYALQYNRTGPEESADFQVINKWCLDTDYVCDEAPCISGSIMFEGVRHIFFGCDEERENTDCGYIYYPFLLSMSECLKRIHEIALEKFEYYREYGDY